MYRIVLLVQISLIGLFALPTVALAQVADPRVAQLEEQLRQLTGQVEELNFQILQMQENFRKQREDLEFRLQELEDKQGAVTETGNPDNELAKTEVPPQKQGSEAVSGPVNTAVLSPRLPAPTGTDKGSPPRNLGAIRLDQNGNIVETSVDFSAQGVERSIDGTNVSSVTGEMNPEDLYKAGYAYILDGDYRLAEGVFSTFVDTYPGDPLIADARFWLGESQLAQGKFEDAADTFIETRSLYPNAAKTPETMLKIGTIMAALGNREVACVTFEDALKNHTDMSVPLRNRIGQERTNAKC